MIEADVRWPTDSGLAADGVKTLAREGRRIAQKRTAVRDRSWAMGRKLRSLTRTIRRRSGEAKVEVLKLTEETGRLLETSIKEARKLAATARRRARGRGAQAKLKAARALEELADRCEKVAGQIRQRVNGEPIKDRLAPAAADNATAPKSKAGSAISNAATAWTDHASKATPATRSGPAGRRSATTPRPTPPSDNPPKIRKPRSGTQDRNPDAKTRTEPPAASHPPARSTPTRPPPGLSGGSS